MTPRNFRSVTERHSENEKSNTKNRTPVISSVRGGKEPPIFGKQQRVFTVHGINTI